jgi:hypothetical protein
VSLTTASKVRVSARRKVRLGRTSFQVDGGETATVSVRLSRKHLRLVRKLKRVRVILTITARDDSGNSRSSKKTMTLRARRG